MKKVFVLALVAAGLAATASFAANSRSAAPAGTSVASTAAVKCGKTRTIGLLAPITGPAASLGTLQVRWTQYYISRYNKTHRRKFRLVKGDTQLPNVSEATKAAQSVAGKASVLGVVGPAGSNEVKATTSILKNAKLGFVSGSATRTDLTTDGTRRGYFFRTVPPDKVQGATVATFISKTLKLKRVYIIDDQEAYGIGLADTVQQRLRAAGVNVKRDGVNPDKTSDFSSLIAKINRNVQLVYLPWQLPPKGQAFGRQMKQAGKGNIRLMGSDGLFDPAFSSVGSNVYDSFFPINPVNGTIAAYKKSHGGKGDFFGAPSYVAAQVVGGAIDRACKDGKATRTEVRKQIRRSKIRNSLLGLTVRYNANGDIIGGRFGIYKSVRGQFQPVG